MSKNSFSVKPIPTSESHEWITKKHYAHRMPAIIISSYGLYENNILKGVCSFGLGGNNNLNGMIELNRLIVDSTEINITSWFVSRCLKYLKDSIVISYADAGQGHTGKIYQACNFLYTGLSSADTEYEKDGVTWHRKVLFNRYGTGSKETLISKGYKPIKQAAKHRYIYISGNKSFKRKALKALKDLNYQILPYPKGETKRYDASFKPISQGVLF